eukprot:COSAG01_NODE_1853_length_9060_cov_13.741576_10_plen_89_part_00
MPAAMRARRLNETAVWRRSGGLAVFGGAQELRQMLSCRSTPRCRQPPVCAVPDTGGARGVRPGVSTTAQPLASQPDLQGELMHVCDQQ